MFLLKKILSSLVLPPFGLALLGLVGLWLSRRHRRPGLALTALALATLGVLSLPLVADGLMHSLERFAPLSADGLAQAQAIVILGGGQYPAAPEYGGRDTVNRWTLERLRYGARLQHQGGLPILVTGGAPYGGRPEAEAMKEALEEDFHGQVRWVEARSRDTAENAAFSAPLLKQAGVTRIVLVSQGWHLARAVALFRKAGLTVLPAPIGYATEDLLWPSRVLPRIGAFDRSCMALHEWLGIALQSMGP
ncbi:MAG: YdcF family protein [Betaproteobacteria bacterium]|nr:YdcF family protein [Betaproteobacteria bacterium]MDE2622513.1 YdcF family protein [Betaproteobacteria bacterium]